VIAAPENLPPETVSDFVAIDLIPLERLADRGGQYGSSDKHILAYKQWLPHPRETIGVRLDDDSMHPILPEGSVVAIDRTQTDPERLQGRMVAACPEGRPLIRWLEISGRHLIFRPNQPSREHPLIPIELDRPDPGLIIGQVVWSWSRFQDA
jgi:hypothetical protein